MKFTPLKITTLALAGLMVAATGTYAGGLYDQDDNGYSGSYNSNNSSYCDKRPYAPDCRDDHDDDYQYKRKTYKKKRHSNRCAAYIRAAGKRNLVTAFARNSARFAWKREVRAVHGSQYAKWSRARSARITCTREGAMKTCVAKATPCKY